MGVRRPKYLTGLQVNKRRCIACSGFSLREPAKCPVIDCKSWPGRFGINPRTAEKRGLLVNPYEAAGKDYGEGDLRGTYKELAEDEPLWWELGIKEMVKRFGAR